MCNYTTCANFGSNALANPAGSAAASNAAAVAFAATHSYAAAYAAYAAGAGVNVIGCMTAGCSSANGGTINLTNNGFNFAINFGAPTFTNPAAPIFFGGNCPSDSYTGSINPGYGALGSGYNGNYIAATINRGYV